MQFLIFFILLLAPLPFGSARPLWEMFWVVYIGIITFSYGALVIQTGLSRSIDFPPKVALTTFILALLCISQALPSFRLEPHLSHDVLSQILISQHFTSVNPSATLSRSVFWFAHILLFIIVYQKIKNLRDSKMYLYAIGFVACIYVLASLVMFFAGNSTVLWYPKTHKFYSLGGTFVNRNHFAAFTGIGLQAWVVIALMEKDTIRQESMSTSEGGSIVKYLTNYKLLLWVLGGILLFTALTLTASRAGFGTSVLGLLCLLVLCRMSKKTVSHHRIAHNYSIVWLAITVILIGFSTLSIDFLMKRYLTGWDIGSRADLYTVLIRNMETQPFLGYGLGTFPDVFPFLRESNIPTHYLKAHNSYLEVMFELGIMGLAIVILLLFSLVVWLSQALTNAQRHRPAIALGLSVTLQLSIHSAFDFPLYIPAISLLYSIIVAVSIAAAVNAVKERLQYGERLSKNL